MGVHRRGGFLILRRGSNRLEPGERRPPRRLVLVSAIVIAPYPLDPLLGRAVGRHIGLLGLAERDDQGVGDEILHPVHGEAGKIGRLADRLQRGDSGLLAIPSHRAADLVEQGFLILLVVGDDVESADGAAVRVTRRHGEVEPGDIGLVLVGAGEEGAEQRQGAFQLAAAGPDGVAQSHRLPVGDLVQPDLAAAAVDSMLGEQGHRVDSPDDLADRPRALLRPGLASEMAEREVAELVPDQPGDLLVGLGPPQHAERHDDDIVGEALRNKAVRPDDPNPNVADRAEFPMLGELGDELGELLLGLLHPQAGAV